MSKYKEYKDSGLPWIGDIPSHWEIMPFKRRMRIYNGADYKSVAADEGYPVMGSGGQFAYAEKYMFDGEVVLLGRKGTIDRPQYFNGPFWAVDTMFYAVADRRVSCKYMYYQALTFPFSYYATATALPSMTQSDLGNNKVCVPPKTEQTAIADYLDAKCKKIDDLILKEEERIKLVEETKLSIITNVITKGLIPKVVMKDSGVPWVGQVPSSWNRHRIKYDLIRSTAGVWGDEEKGNDDDIVCYRIADFDYTRGILDNDNPTVRNIPAKDRQGRLLNQGDLLIEKSGGGDIWPVGRVVRYNYDLEAVCSNFIHSVTVDERKIDKDFLYYYFKFLYANKVNYLFFNQTTGIQNLKVSAYLSQTLYAPELKEQKEIVDYLNKECDFYNKSIDKANHQINLLKEYKRSLITEVVTGKVKVC